MVFRSTMRLEPLLLAVILGSVASTPLQWEQIKAVGIRPEARHSHATVTMDAMQSTLFIFGGYGFDGVPSNANMMDVWLLDFHAKGWERVLFEGTPSTGVPAGSGFQYTDTDFGCKAHTINAKMPANRAGHSAVSTGAEALVCGGYSSKNPSQTAFAGNGIDLECWWFTPVPFFRFDPLKVTPASPKPVARFGHAMAEDPQTGHVFLFGGMTKGNTVMNDCWILNLTPVVNISNAYAWLSCTPNSTKSLVPTPRYGAGSVFHEASQTFYIYGGFAWNGRNFAATNDLWVLYDFNSVKDMKWHEVNAVTEQPMARGFHAMWLSGFTIYIHGGQGPGGSGGSSVRADTWSYDIFTRVWMQYGSSAASPVASSLSIAQISSSSAVAFGGLSSDSKPMDACVVFNIKSGWKTMEAAGTRPPRSAGQVAIYDSNTYQMIVSFGMAAGPTLLDDMWILDLSSMIWICASGSSRQCIADTTQRISFGTAIRHGKSSNLGVRPSARAFAAGHLVGHTKFSFGGLVQQQVACTPSLKKDVYIGSNEFWAMNTVTHEWSKVKDLANSTAKTATAPSARAFSQMTSHRNVGGYLNPIFLVGGANMTCMMEDPPCTAPQPMNDIWIADAAKKATSANDKMCILDGEDDIIAIGLPVWCRKANKMGTMWLDMWLQVQTRGNDKTILLDAYHEQTALLRWFMQGEGKDTFVVMLLKPGNSEVQVKKWGPVPHDTVTLWHHFCFTVRFARFVSSSSDVQVAVAQAFFFLDGRAVREVSLGFMTFNIKKSLSISTGLSHVFVGGPNPSVSASGYRFLHGHIDLVRIWWPSCPHANDPSKCNPFGFLYPKLKDGRRQPSSGINDADVQMVHVAKPVRDAMFSSTVPDGQAQGLLVSIDFEGDVAEGLLANDANPAVLPECLDSDFTRMMGKQPTALSMACPGCDSFCTFDVCPVYDLDCIGPALNGLNAVFPAAAAFDMYASIGKCQCRDVDSCPKTIEDCLCPPGLYRICEVCQIGDDTYTSASSAGAAAMCHLDDGECKQWGCSCFNYNPQPSSSISDAFQGTFLQKYETDKNTGTARCLVDEKGTPLCQSGEYVSDEARCCSAYFPLPSDLDISDPAEVGGKVPPFLCGMKSCCLNKRDEEGTRGNVFKKEGSNEAMRSTSEVQPETNSMTTLMKILDMAGIDNSVNGLLIAAGLDLNTLRMMAEDRTYLAAELREAGIAKPGDRARIIDALQSTSKNAELNKQVDEAAEMGLDGMQQLSKSDVSTSAAMKPRSLLRRDKRRVEGGGADGMGSYDGGHALLKLQVEFTEGSISSNDFAQMLFKCPDSQVSSCDDNPMAPNYQTYKFQEKFFSDANNGALNSAFPALTFEIANVEQNDKQISVFGVYFRVSGKLDETTGLFDLSDDGINRKKILEKEETIKSLAQCCGQTVEKNGHPRGPPTTEWAGCAEECGDPRDENPKCSADQPSLCSHTVGQLILSDFTTGQGLKQLDTFALIPYVCGDGYRQTKNHDIGLTWRNLGTTQPSHGRLLTNEMLANALRGKTEFTQDEFDAFVIADLRENDYIMSAGRYFTQKPPEDCDLGYEYTSKYSTCSDGSFYHCENDRCEEIFDEKLVCQCNTHKGFTLDPVTNTCLCSHNVQPTKFVATESTQRAGANNTITLKIVFYGEVQANEHNPLVVEIVNLMGSSTPTNPLLEVGFFIGDSEFSQNPKIGVLNKKSDITDSDNAWLWGKGEWNQITGTLKFTVLERITKESPSLTVKVVLKNRVIAQDAVRPYLRICGKTSWAAVFSGVLNYLGFDTQGYTGQGLLGSYVSTPGGCGTSACALKKANLQGGEETVAEVSFAAVQGPSMVVATPEALVLRGLSTQMYAMLPAASEQVPCNLASASDTMPTCSTLAGKLGTLLTVAAASLANNALLNQVVDTSVVRRRGGCITTDTQSFDICLPGSTLSPCSVGLYRFVPFDGWHNDEHKLSWFETYMKLLMAPFLVSGMAGSRVGASEEEVSTWAALATSPCCDYEGAGAACGDAVCLDTTDPSDSAVKIQLGEGTLSKMPAVDLTDRPLGAEINLGIQELWGNYEWSDVPQSMKTQLQVLGWSAKSWVADVSPSVLSMPWSELTSLQKTAAYNLGVDQEMWEMMELREPTSASSNSGPGNSNNENVLNLRVGWVQVCPDMEGGVAPSYCNSNLPDSNWFPARFGHVVEAVGTSNLLIYGGMGCKTYESLEVKGMKQERCTVVEVLDDLWAFDIKKAMAGQHPFSQVETSPRLPGLLGMAAATLQNVDNRILTFGGSSVFHLSTFLRPQTQAVEGSGFQVRELAFRARKAASTHLDMPEQSLCADIQNSTHLVMFGGFVGNDLSSCVFIYELAAAQPSLGFNAVPILSLQAPSARGYAGLVKPDDNTLIMFGGFSKSVGRADLWKLDIGSSSWKMLAKEDKSDPTKPTPAAFNAFCSFRVSGMLVFASFGGVVGGYDSSLSFSEKSTGEYSVTMAGRWMSWEANAQSFAWQKTLVFHPRECCDAQDYGGPDAWTKCRKAGYWGRFGCEPLPRAMHTVTWGLFIAGVESLLMFGGVGQRGNALQDMWYMSLRDSDLALGGSFQLWFNLNNVAPLSTWPDDKAPLLQDLKRIVARMVQNVNLLVTGKDVSWFELDLYDFDFDSTTLPDDKKIFFSFKMVNRLTFQPEELVWTANDVDLHGLFLALHSNNSSAVASIWSAARDSQELNTNIFKQATLTCASPSHEWGDGWGCLAPAPSPQPDVGFKFEKYDDQRSCNPETDGAKCMRGICMGTKATTAGQVAMDEYKNVQYCYRSDAPGLKATPCTVTTETGTTTTNLFACSLPHARHGHGATSFSLLGKSILYAIFGGETTDLVPAHSGATSTLTNNVHTLYFTAKTVTWIKLWTSCDDNIMSSEPVCPEPRRDMALSIMGNEGGENGRLLVFGGAGGASQNPQSELYYKHGMKGYLDGATNSINFKAFDDLWYLDLSDLDSECAERGLCTKSLLWRRVDVTGSRPGVGFGAGVLLDSKDNFFIIGGVDSTLSERGELYVFQLQDPFYKHCSATGAALTSARAGVTSVFYIQCMDNFMEPANGATFKVDIAGPVGMIPGILSLGDGKYSCSYTPEKVGAYVISIYVGRGGTKYQDLITGRDIETSNNVHEFEKQCNYINGAQECKSSQNPYALIVEPGTTNAAVTTALGTSLTLTTAGIASDFMITAKDDFSNRRPGGDTISVLMRLWSCKVGYKQIDVDDGPGVQKCLRLGSEAVKQSPETGTVRDNADGSHFTGYIITRAGQYSLSIEISGTRGANSPYILTVNTDKADMSLTYAYGALAGIQAGVASQLYVQTRDRFGNAIRADVDLYPLREVNGGTEDIQFELCYNPVGTSDDKCGGGKEYTDVGIEIRYAIGPDGQETDPKTGEPYWGLYKIEFFPFNAEPVIPRVRHGDKADETSPATLVKCYFDTIGLEASRDAMDPGAEQANACIQEVAQAEILSARRGQKVHHVFPIVDVSHKVLADETHSNEKPGLKRSLSLNSWRRGPKVIKMDDLVVEIKSTFTPPNTDLLMQWTAWIPFICAGIAAFLALLSAILDFINKRQNKKICALMKAADKNKDGGIEFEEFCEIPENAGNAEDDDIPMPIPQDDDLIISELRSIPAPEAAG